MNKKHTRNIPILLASATLVFLLSSKGFAGPPRCFMHGVMVPRYDPADNNTMSNMLRLNFDANDKTKCEQMMMAYCQENVKGQNYSPIRLKASFKPDVDKTDETTYEFTEGCKLNGSD